MYNREMEDAERARRQMDHRDARQTGNKTNRKTSQESARKGAARRWLGVAHCHGDPGCALRLMELVDRLSVRRCTLAGLWLRYRSDGWMRVDEVLRVVGRRRMRMWLVRSERRVVVDGRAAGRGCGCRCGWIRLTLSCRRMQRVHLRSGHVRR